MWHLSMECHMEAVEVTDPKTANCKAQPIMMVAMVGIIIWIYTSEVIAVFQKGALMGIIS